MNNLSLSNILFIALIATIIFAACESSDEPGGLKIPNSEIAVDFQDSVLIEAISDYEIAYTIEDPFIATINGDHVKGRHVGTTTILALSNGETEDIEVKVRSVYNLFENPIDDYSDGKEYYKNKFTDIKYEDDSTVVFLQINYDLVFAYYIQINLTSNNTTKHALLVFQIGLSGDVFNTLAEHFEIYDHTDIGYFLINALEPSDATELAIFQLDKEEQLCYALIGKNESFKTTSNKNYQTKSFQSPIKPVIRNLHQNHYRFEF